MSSRDNDYDIDKDDIYEDNSQSSGHNGAADDAVSGISAQIARQVRDQMNEGASTWHYDTNEFSFDDDRESSKTERETRRQTNSSRYQNSSAPRTVSDVKKVRDEEDVNPFLDEDAYDNTDAESEDDRRISHTPDSDREEYYGRSSFATRGRNSDNDRRGRAQSSSRYTSGGSTGGGRGGSGSGNGDNGPKKHKKWGVGKKILVTFLSVLGAIVLLGGVYYFYVMAQIKYENQPSNSVSENEIVLTNTDNEDNSTVSNAPAIDPADIVWDTEDTDYRHEDGVINILLIGEENIDKDARGRSDSMMIATIDRNRGKLMLTSLMRDCYVQIPDYQGHHYRDNKLNAAYALGGVTLTINTIEKNFDFQIDGYAKVDFSGFEGLIDALGGVEITLSKKEADYLNSTNYISKKKYRTVVEGTQTLNGNQALGYSRIRHVPTPEGVADDYGRTLRQRKVLNAIFEKYKNSNLVTLLAMMPAITKMVTTDLSMTEITKLMTIVVGLHPSKLETLRVPVDNSFSDKVVSGVGDSLILDWSTNKEALHRFLFGTSDAEKAAGLTAAQVAKGYTVSNGKVVAPTKSDNATTDTTNKNTTDDQSSTTKTN